VTERRRRLLAVLAGLCIALGQVPFSLVPAALGGLAALIGLAGGTATARQAAWIGWCGGTAYFGLALHWIVAPFMVDAARHAWMAPFAAVLLSGGLALFWALALGLARRLAGGWRFALAAAGGLAAAEMLRSLVLTGFPWALVGYVWTEGGGAQIAAYVGPFGLTLLTCLLAALVAMQGTRPVRALAVLTLASIMPPGVAALRHESPEPSPEAARLRLVQPNAPQDEKWDRALAATFFQRALDQTAAPGETDLVIWPETSVPYLLEPGHPALDRIAAAAGQRSVVLGAQRLEEPRYYNSLLLVGPEGAIAATYDKHHLVPFGEYVPFGDLAARFGIYGLASGEGFGYSAGDGPRLLDLGRFGRVLPLICYEVVFPEEVGGTARPDWLLQITNDAWFGTFAGPQQHLAQARMRAIEQGLPLVRAANTGISAVIDATGRVRAALPLGTAGHLDASLPPALDPTPYARTGDWPTVAAIAVMLLASGAATTRNRA
jgi:apolipoprotein N-acyltransferase